MTGAPPAAGAGRLLPALAALALLFLALPIAGLLGQVSPDSLVRALAAPALARALALSLLCTLAALALALAFGLPLALLLARREFPGRALVRALVALPMVLPPVASGLALLGVYGRRAPLGGLLDDLGLPLPFTTAGAVVAVTYVAAPFLILSLEAGLTAIDPRLEATTAALGARPWRVFTTITLPLLRPALAAGLALAGARALGEFGATITFAGNLEGRTQTLPLALYAALHGDPAEAHAIALVLLLLALLVLLPLRGRLAPR